MFGDSVNVAARMVGLAKSGQVIVSGSTAGDTIAGASRARLREVDVLTVKGKDKDIAILELDVAGLGRSDHADDAS